MDPAPPPPSLAGPPIMRPPDAREEKLHERGLFSVSRLWSNHTQQRKNIANHYLFPLYREE